MCYLISARFTQAEVSLLWLLGIPSAPQDQGKEEFLGLMEQWGTNPHFQDTFSSPRWKNNPCSIWWPWTTSPTLWWRSNYQRDHFNLWSLLPCHVSCPRKTETHWGLLPTCTLFSAAIISHLCSAHLHGWINKFPEPPGLGKYQLSLELFVSIPQSPHVVLLFYTEGFRAFEKPELFLEWQELYTQLENFSKQATQHSLEFCCEPGPFSRELGSGKPCI